MAKIKHNCRVCNKEFRAHECNYRLYCSRQCADIGRKTAIIQTYKCKQCAKEFESKQIAKRLYCSSKCYKIASNEYAFGEYDGYSVHKISNGYLGMCVNGRSKKLHIYIAEKALGKPLPKCAQVHHIDGNKHNNESSNLLIMQNNKEHLSLHARQRIQKMGGNWRTDKICGSCKKLLSRSQFYECESHFDGLTGACRECQKASSAISRRRLLKIKLLKKQIPTDMTF